MKKTFKILLFIFGVPILSFLLVLNYILPKKNKIKFSNFRANRIAHFALGYYTTYARIKLNKFQPNTIFYIDKSICSNQYLLESISRELNVKDWARIPIYLCKKVPFLSSLYDRKPSQVNRDKEGLTQKVSMPKFTDAENNFCIKWLKDKGWKGPNQPLVCLQVRDSAFLNKFFNKTPYEDMNWDYHNYRYTKIDSYKTAVEWMQEKPQSAFIVRTGKVAKQKLSLNNKNFIDYPFIEDQNDLIDIWLFANSDLVISTGTGPDFISASYKVPTIYLNFLPLGSSHTWSKCLHASKHLYWSNSKRHLTIEEYTLANFYKTNEYADMGIEIKDLSNKEILEIIKEGWDYFFKGKEIKKEDLKATASVKKILSSSSLHKTNNSWFHPQWIISSTFLKEKIN